VQAGAQFLCTTSHVIGNGRSTRHSRQFIRQTQCNATNFIFYSKLAVHNFLQLYFGTGEDDKKARIDSRWYNSYCILTNGINFYSVFCCSEYYVFSDKFHFSKSCLEIYLSKRVKLQQFFSLPGIIFGRVYSAERNCRI
jgi:hypothetical protein